MKTLVSLTSAAVLSLGLMGTAAAAADGKALYASKGCAACHGPDANTPILPVYPKLAGQNPDYAFNQMKDIKSGARANGQSAAMKAIVANISDDELKAIADWLGTLSQ